MNSSVVIERVNALTSCDISMCSTAELRDRLSDIRNLRSWLDFLQSQVVASLSDHDSVMPEVELIRESGLSTSDARKVMSRTETIGSVPVFGDALADAVLFTEGDSGVDRFIASLPLLTREPAVVENLFCLRRYVGFFQLGRSVLGWQICRRDW